MVVYRKCYQITMILCTTHNDEILFTIRVSDDIFVFIFTVYVNGLNLMNFISFVTFCSFLLNTFLCFEYVRRVKIS